MPVRKWTVDTSRGCLTIQINGGPGRRLTVDLRTVVPLQEATRTPAERGTPFLALVTAY
jgi:hypothetical protein